MSRWLSTFKNHSFHSHWESLKNASESIKLTDETVITDVEELARLRKVIAYIDELLTAADPELLPLSIFNNFNSQSQECLNQLKAYVQSRNIGHIQNANNNLDNLLSYIRPYVVSGKGAAQAAGKAFKAYSDIVNRNVDSLKSKTQSIVNEIQQLKTESIEIHNEILRSKKSIQSFEEYLFQGTEQEKSLQERVRVLFDQTKEWHSKIFAYFQKLTKGNEQEGAIILQISQAKDDATKNTAAINSALESVEDEIEEISQFYSTIFGEENEDGEVEGGLKKEVEHRLTDLDSFKKQQQETYQTMLDEINSLLPGATSAGLATAYKDLRVAAETQVTKYTNIFYITLGILSFMAAILVVYKISWPLSIEFIDVLDPIMWLQKFIYKLPLLGPLLWLTLFSSKRRSEFQRLQQEYAHKESLAKSYHSFKKQIEGLNEQDSVLMKKLLDAAITAISFNASKTLDGKHGDKIPVQEIIENAIQRIKK